MDMDQMDARIDLPPLQVCLLFLRGKQPSSRAKTLSDMGLLHRGVMAFRM